MLEASRRVRWLDRGGFTEALRIAASYQTSNPLPSTSLDPWLPLKRSGGWRTVYSFPDIRGRRVVRAPVLPCPGSFFRCTRIYLTTHLDMCRRNNTLRSCWQYEVWCNRWPRRIGWTSTSTSIYQVGVRVPDKYLQSLCRPDGVCAGAHQP